MSSFKSRREYSSRLARQEAKRFTTQAIGFGFLAIAIIALVIFVGIPGLIKLSVFLGELNSSANPINQTDTIPPPPPQLIPLPEAINTTTVTIEGYAEKGSFLSLYINGAKAKESLVDDQGAFTFHNMALVDGLNTIYAKTKDAAGNESSVSPSVQVYVYTENPTITISYPVEGQKFFGLSNQQLVIEGSTANKNRVLINEHQALMGADGTFKHRLQLNEGDNTITVTAIDPAGNQTEETIKVSFQP
jgi:hypothetical protein